MSWLRGMMLWCGVVLMACSASAKPLVGDISSHEITLHTAFSGTELMFFGARNEPGDIVVVVRGPERKAMVHQKAKTYGIWINRHKQRFEPIPGFYALASSRPYEEIAKSFYFDALGVGYDAAIDPLLPDFKQPGVEERLPYHRALIAYLKEQGLYNQSAGKITFIGETLFKVTFPFPDTTPRGDYTAEMHLFSGGQLVSTHITPIEVYKIGFDAFVYQAAQNYSFLYGVAAVILALLGGWTAAMAFRKV